MNEEKYRALLGYKTIMAVVKTFLENGAITEAEFMAIDTVMSQKYGLPSYSIYR